MKLPPPKRTPSLDGRGRRTKRAPPSCDTERDATQDSIELPDFLKRYYSDLAIICFIAVFVNGMIVLLYVVILRMMLISGGFQRSA